MTTTVYLIRHGQTDWNATGRWQGHADVPLNVCGLQQARLLAQRLKDEEHHFDVIYSSDLARAYQTAWEVGAVLKVAVQLLPALREIDLGVWSGLTREEIRERYPVEMALLEAGEDVPRGGGETRSAQSRRVLETIEAMIEQHPGKTMALVTHGGTIHAVLRHIEQQYGPLPQYQGHIGNTAVTILRCEPDRWQVITYNDMQHLENLDGEQNLISLPPDDAEQPQE
jgi:probable phosphoglycerate mutase